MDKPRVLYIYKFDSHRKYSCEATPLPLEEFSVVKELTNNTFALQFGNLSGGIRSRFDNAPKKTCGRSKKRFGVQTSFHVSALKICVGSKHSKMRYVTPRGGFVFCAMQKTRSTVLGLHDYNLVSECTQWFLCKHLKWKLKVVP